MKPFPDLTLPIVGAVYPNPGKGPTRLFEIAICAPGDKVELRPEPKNPHDEHAIAVYSERDVQMGYIPSVRAVRIGQLLRQGCGIVAVFQAKVHEGALIRLSFDGSIPDLPPEEPPSDDPDWYPDPVYDDF